MISRWARVHTRSVPSKSILSRRRSPKSFLVLFGALEIIARGYIIEFKK